MEIHTTTEEEKLVTSPDYFTPIFLSFPCSAWECIRELIMTDCMHSIIKLWNEKKISLKKIDEMLAVITKYL